MEFNVCKYCLAKDGRAGLLVNSPSKNIDDACENCYDTLNTGVITIHSRLNRTTEELKRTLNLLNESD